MAPNLIPSFPSSTPAGVSCANSHCVTKTLAPGRERRRQSDRVFFFLEARARKSRPRLSVPEGGFGSRCLDHHPPPPSTRFSVYDPKFSFLPPPGTVHPLLHQLSFFSFWLFSSPHPPLSSFPFCLSQGPLHNQGTVGGAREGRVKRQKIEAMPPPPLQRKEEEERGCTGGREFLCLLLLCLWFFVPCTWIRRAIGHYSDPANLVLIETSFLIACGLTRQVLLVRQDKPPGM